MKIQVSFGPYIGYTPFTFPDGQRHITLDADVSNSEVQITTSLTCADDLFDLLLVNDILTHNKNTVHLRIEYLLGARMDARINDRQPFTMQVVSRIINIAGFKSVTVLDPHSRTSLAMLHGAMPPVYPMTEFLTALKDFTPEDTVIIQPDFGAQERVRKMASGMGFRIIECSKERDSASGKLFNPKILKPALVESMRCLIVDDICDGGATFVALARKLREAGARDVSLFVTHGIFSKGRDLEGIDKIYSTDSFTGKVWPKGGTRTETNGFCNCTWGGSPAAGGLHRGSCPKAVP